MLERFERAPAHLLAPGLPFLRVPLDRPFGAAASDDVEELASSHVRDGGRELLVAVGSAPHEEHFVAARAANGAVAAGLVDEGLAVSEHGVVHRVPCTAELAGHLGHAPRTPADRFGDPAPGPIGHDQTRAAIRGPPRSMTSWRNRDRDSTSQLFPPRGGRSSEARQVDQLHVVVVFHLGEHPHAGHRGAPAASSRAHAPAGAPEPKTPSTVTSGKPTSSLHIRVGLVSTGALRIDRR